jgi:hypothetical protein
MLLAASGCSSDGDPLDDRDGDREQSTPVYESHDPPQRFDQSSAVALPEAAAHLSDGGWYASDSGKPAVTLMGTQAYVAVPDGLHVLDVITGETIDVIEPEHRPLITSEDTQFAGNPAHPPLVTDVGGTQAVLVPFLTEVAGQGTTASRDVIELVAVATENHEVLWRHLIETADCGGFSAHDCDITVVGASDGVAVLGVAEDNGTPLASYGINLAGPTTEWELDDFAATMVAGDLTIGVLADGVVTSYAAAYETSNGSEQRWIDDDDTYDLTVQPAGPHWALATSTGAGFGAEDEVRLIDPRTGEPAPTEVDGFSDGMRCDYDETSVVVCATTSNAVAFVAQSAEVLWSLPDENEGRVAPTIRSAWHGLIYGETSNGPVILDARSGRDAVLDPGIAPRVVNEYVGVAPAESGGLLAYRARD